MLLINMDVLKVTQSVGLSNLVETEITLHFYIQSKLFKYNDYFIHKNRPLKERLNLVKILLIASTFRLILVWLNTKY
jgi:hypothetical protein